ncbi:MAG TPA: hypothetical protein PLX33_00915 [Alphaproteobacteria bacterium]|nr:hypothetical protein [Alphaproteobacteria bacterium]
MKLIRTLRFSHNHEELEVRAIEDELGGIKVRVFRDGEAVTPTSYILKAEDIADGAADNIDLLGRAMEIAKTDVQEGNVAVDRNRA